MRANNIDTKEETPEQEKVIALFQFIAEINKLKQRAVLNYKDHDWYMEMSNIHEDVDHIKIFYRDRVEEEKEDVGSILLSVRKAEFQCCPDPDEIFVDWLKEGWDSYKISDATVKDILDINKQIEKEESADVEHFADNKDRVEKFENWKRLRSIWVLNQIKNQKTNNIFTSLYRLYFELQKESETMEIIVANGIFCDKENQQYYSCNM